MSDRVFKLPGAAWDLTITEDALRHMYAHRQTGRNSKEAGGQLFCPNPHEVHVVVQKATGPYRSDKSGYARFELDPKRANDDRTAHFAQGLHCVGLWHSHDQANPRPSPTDRSAAANHLRATMGELTGFLLLTLGSGGEPPPLSVFVSSNSEEWLELQEVDSSS